MNEQKMRIERSRKPAKCPVCGASPVASILYGMPAFNQELEQKMEEGRITLGGCCIEIDGPVWECSHCGQKIYRKRKIYDLENFE